jgi:hypothetical protein
MAREKFTQVAYTVDKNGRQLAYEYSRGMMRWFRISVKEAAQKLDTGASYLATKSPDNLPGNRVQESNQ